MGYVCLLDERGDNGTFANTLWEVQYKFGNKDHDKKKLVPSPTNNMRTSLRMLSFFSWWSGRRASRVQETEVRIRPDQVGPVFTLNQNQKNRRD
jgi:hypothetical protein